jgi:hypothetical protein
VRDVLDGHLTDRQLRHRHLSLVGLSAIGGASINFAVL